jgi:hypothetical protein
MDLPTLMKGGPSPRMRALANQEVLTFRRWAVSLGGRRTKLGIAGFCSAAASMDAVLEDIVETSPQLLMVRFAGAQAQTSGP